MYNKSEDKGGRLKKKNYNVFVKHIADNRHLLIFRKINKVYTRKIPKNIFKHQSRNKMIETVVNG